jgi:leucyl aminopeptidase
MNVTVATQEPAKVAADALVVNLFEGEKPNAGRLAALDQRLNGGITQAVDLGEAAGRLYATAVLPSAGSLATPRLLVIGAGKSADFDQNRARNLAGAAVRAIGRRPIASLALWLTGPDGSTTFPEATVNGAVLASFDPGEYKSKPDETRPILTSLTVVETDSGKAAAAKAQAERGSVLGEAANLARHLANAPGNLLNPSRLADEAIRGGTADGFAVDILDRSRMASIGMGALLGVAQGSEQPPALIVMTYRGRDGEDFDLAIVGKGVTFDTGGISIKPAADMHLMKEDMAGAAATIGAMSAIARLRVRSNVLGIVPAVENMPSGRAMRPGDVLTAMNGKTIEVLNTDAEGRIILADAICYAQQLGAKRIVDAATLTGAVVVALGHEAAGLLGTPQEWVDEVKRASERAGERLWQLPLYEEYTEQLKSQVADVANVGGRAAGTITGAMFIRQFVDDGVSWSHLDIAGTAWTERDLPYLAKGPTGMPMRTFVALAEAAQK